MKYQSTGEVRPIREGEYFLTNSNPHNVRRADSIWVKTLRKRSRVIMEPVTETPDDFDTQVQADEVRCEGCGAASLAECMCDQDWSEREDELAGFEIPFAVAVS